LKVYNAMGQVVRVVEDKHRAPGVYAAQWDGLSDAGEPVASGLYFYKMDAGGFTATRKLLLIK
jgi:flagellar hook assembly protein FlgD